MLNCPQDQTELVNVEIEDVPIARCPTCGGHWLRSGDLETLNEHHGEHEQPVQIGAMTSGEGLRQCPVDGTLMRVCTFAEHRNLRVDQCPECRGLWLEKTELETLLAIHSENSVDEDAPTPGQRAMLFLYYLTEHPPYY